MHFSKIVFLLAISFALSLGCVHYHGQMYNDPFTGDSVYVYLEDNGQVICDAGQTKYFASDETVFNIHCIDGYALSVTNNGKKFHYVTPHGTFDFVGPATFSVNKDCYEVSEHIKLACSTYEYNAEIWC
eukprot:Phypoly_transcript_27061.p1 GENE.Phypoly_transcript_27061~~Phypoly_transcript_27061.p1  ORF type:complete len:129 (+),score=12.19 Phypoly_transcript_27061:42-428(+)